MKQPILILIFLLSPMTIKFLATYWRVQMHLRVSEIAEQYDGLTRGRDTGY